MTALRGRMTQIESKPWVEQTDLRDRLIEVNRHLLEIISQT